MPHLPPGNIFPPDGVPASASGPRLAGEMLRRQREAFGLELERAGLFVEAWWTDPARDFAVVLAHPRS